MSCLDHVKVRISIRLYIYIYINPNSTDLIKYLRPLNPNEM